MLVGVVISVGTLLFIFSFYNQRSLEPKDCAVVFGAAVWPGGSPSDALSDRTSAALDAYEEHQVGCLVFSGADSAYGKHEVEVMLDIAYKRGVDLADVELDYDGRNTKQTIQNLDSSRSYLFVSNDFHLARISLLARQAHLQNYAVYSSEYLLGRYSREPYFIFREMVALWYYAFSLR